MHYLSVKKRNLAPKTFIAVFVSIVVVGSLIMPMVLDRVEQTYITLQADVNRRQAVAMAQFIRSRITQGASKDQVVADFQTAIEGSDADRGYVCLIDQGSTEFLCHPIETLVGVNIAEKNAVFDAGFTGENLRPWEQAITAPSSVSGLLLIGDAESRMEEVVHSEVISELGWVVNSHENTSFVRAEIAQYRVIILIGSTVFAFLLAFPVSFSVRRVSRSYEKQIETSNVMLADERERADKLLESILPRSIAERMKLGEQNIVSHHVNVAILFCDIVGFTRIASVNGPEKIAKLLSKLFTQFDKLCVDYGAEKIKTIGDAYMAVCGLPEPVEGPAQKIVQLACAMQEFVNGQAWGIKVRIGIHLGEAAAGVIGSQKFSYDLWGDAVNIAARLEASGEPGAIHISQAMKDALTTTQDGEQLRFTDRGQTPLKGKGSMQTWFVTKR